MPDSQGSFSTLPQMILSSFEKYADKPFLGHISKDSAEYQYATYNDVAKRVRYVAGGMLSLGIERGERVAILAENCPEWAICDLACQMIGAISVPLFTTLPVEQIDYIIRDSAPRLIFVSDHQLSKKAQQVKQNVDFLEAIVLFEGDSDEKVLLLRDLATAGEEFLHENNDEYQRVQDGAAPDEIATLIYTSGTTGHPKGVQLTHRNITTNVEGAAQLRVFDDSEKFLSFLPLAHSYERTTGFYLPLRLGAAIAYCESLFTVDKNIRQACPTIMLAVPRLYEVMTGKIFDAAKALPENKSKKFKEALALAIKAGAKQGGRVNTEKLSFGERAKRLIYERLVYAKIRQKFGGCVKFFVAGGAPLPPDIASLFWGIGIPLLEGYGLTETSPLISVNMPSKSQIGSVGIALNNVQVNIAADGEILVRGDSIFSGYWNNDEATREVLDENHWFHTGDIGALDNSGFLSITGRKKELLILANGKNVAPAPIEINFARSPLIAQIILLGNGMKGIGALIVPDYEHLHDWAQQHDLACKNDSELIALPQVKKLYRQEINERSNALANFEKVKQIALLDHPFSVENGEMTPTLKLRRHVITRNYGHLFSL